MTSTYQNYSSHYSPNLQDHVLFSSPNVYHDAETNHSSSPSPLSTRDFFSLITDHHQDYSGSYYHKELQQPQIQLDQVNDDFALNGGSCEHIENESSDNGLKFSIWKKEDHTSTAANYNDDQKTSATKFQVKWISSEMRLMQKMNNTDSTTPRMSTTSLKLEDQKQPSSDPMETDNTSNTTSSNTMISNINQPIRVCSDCNTTKTPLWRSGPQGPKTLCNACGIRQRKARRAMAAAAAANGTSTWTNTKPPVLIKKSKSPQKDKTKNSNILKRSSSVVSKFKNQGKVAATSSNQDKKKLCLEDFLLSLSKNLAFYTVFPQDEKEAAILLMALSFGHAHG